MSIPITQPLLKDRSPRGCADLRPWAEEGDMVDGFFFVDTKQGLNVDS